MAQRCSSVKPGAAKALHSIVKYFETLPDPRHHRNRRHLLADIITISVCGVIVGCDGPTSINDSAKAKEHWLKQFLESFTGVTRAVPSADVRTRASPLSDPGQGYRVVRSDAVLSARKKVGSTRVA